jgi:hypothetical protein
MIPAILIGRESENDFTGKNVIPIYGRPIMAYPLLAAMNSVYVDEVYVMTNSEYVKDITREYCPAAKTIERPSKLSKPDTSVGSVFAHGLKTIKAKYKKDIEMIVLLFCNSINILSGVIDIGIEVLRENPDIDSAASVSRYNIYNPIRAQRISKTGFLEPFVPMCDYSGSLDITCDRIFRDDVFFHDFGVSIVRPKCLQDNNYGELPHKWMGKKVYPLVQEEGFDADLRWQLPQAQEWLSKNGFSYKTTPYMLFDNE